MKGPVLVTGASGLIGAELVPVLRRAGYEVVATARAGDGMDRRADLTVRAEAEALVAAVRPAGIVHLAGGLAQDRDELYRRNVLATVHLLRAAARLPEAPACIVLGSAAEYGAGSGRGLVSEEEPLRPVSDYGRAKAAQVLLARGVAASGGLQLTVLRPFNVVSPGLADATPLGNIRRQLVAGVGKRRRVECGRLDVVRDFVPVAAVVESIRRLLAQPRPGATINVCSGRGIELGRILEAMARRLGVTAVPSASPALATLPAADRVVGDPGRLRDLLGLIVEVSPESIATELLRGVGEGLDGGGATEA